MSFSNMLEILKEKNKKTIVLVKLGVFYIATGKDAIFLNKKLGLKCVCFKKQVCKIGIPSTNIEHYLKKLNNLKIAYVAYEFDTKNQKLIKSYEYIGKDHKEVMENRNCLICKGIRINEKDKYMNAVKKMLEEEHENARKKEKYK